MTKWSLARLIEKHKVPIEEPIISSFVEAQTYPVASAILDHASSVPLYHWSSVTPSFNWPSLEEANNLPELGFFGQKGFGTQAQEYGNVNAKLAFYRNMKWTRGLQTVNAKQKNQELHIHKDEQRFHERFKEEGFMQKAWRVPQRAKRKTIHNQKMCSHATLLA
ncbi:hypothetical protein VNO80_08172 [Phaseolus coccineus]|uniref:Uncharacterized protein n=1 Tax=Phaseolus coccineus TaxID=3886 RepID=A0AAN9RFZ9_PHACN